MFTRNFDNFEDQRLSKRKKKKKKTIHFGDFISKWGSIVFLEISSFVHVRLRQKLTVKVSLGCLFLIHQRLILDGFTLLFNYLNARRLRSLNHGTYVNYTIQLMKLTIEFLTVLCYLNCYNKKNIKENYTHRTLQ